MLVSMPRGSPLADALGELCHGDSVNRGTSTVYSNDASLYNW
jgi:hypothetical protein